MFTVLLSVLSYKLSHVVRPNKFLGAPFRVHQALETVILFYFSFVVLKLNFCEPKFPQNNLVFEAVDQDSLHNLSVSAKLRFLSQHTGVRFEQKLKAN